MSNHEKEQGRKIAVDSSERAHEDNYDPHIVPAETAARREREKEDYKHLDTQDHDKSTDELAETGGYTVDKEGLVNAYAIEPEMYYEVPGDARQQAEEDKARRTQELIDVNHDKEGELTMEGDKRGRGPGAI